MAASGLPGFECINVTGMLAPARTPAAIIVQRLGQEAATVLNGVETKEQFAAAGLEAVGSTSPESAAPINPDNYIPGYLPPEHAMRSPVI